jgi:chitinase
MLGAFFVQEGAPMGNIRRIAAIAVTAGVTAVAGLVAATPAQAAFTGATLLNKRSSTCMTVKGGVATVGTAVTIRDCDTSTSQKWTTTTAGEIRVTIGGVTRCLDAYDGGTANGTKLIIWNCQGSGNQKFTHNADNSIRATASGRCLDINGSNTTFDTPVVLWDCKNGGNGSQTWTPNGTPPTQPPTTPGGKHAWPYVDITATSPTMAQAAAATGHRFYTAAFIIGSAAGCVPTWGGTIPLNEARIINDIKAIRNGGGDVTIAFGGAAGPYLEHLCTTQASLANAYKQVLDATGATHLDIDIEATVNLDVMNKALAQVQKERPGTKVSFTLMVQGDDYGLTPALGVDLLKNAKANGVNVGIVNPMTMEFGSSRADWGDAVIAASNATLGQMAQIWPEKTDAQRKAMLGVTPMIGRNFNGKIFQVEDGTQLVNWANQNKIGMLGFWSVGRDNGGCPGGGISPTCSSISQSQYQFTTIFKGFTG